MDKGKKITFENIIFMYHIGKSTEERQALQFHHYAQTCFNYLLIPCKMIEK